MTITRHYFKLHKLELSCNKSKILSYNVDSGHSVFSGGSGMECITLEQVIAFKYLGVAINSSSRGFFKTFNDNVKKKARQYMLSVMSLSKTGPDRSELAYTLWTTCALPAILYGSEVVPLFKGTIEEIEKCQSKVGKFILQLPSNTANVCSNIDAGLRPVWASIAERVIMYASNLLSKNEKYWARKALGMTSFV